MKPLAISAYKQTTGYSCGPASLKMVLTYYDIDAAENDIAKQVKSQPELGTHPTNLRRAALAYGLAGRWSKHATIDDLRKQYTKRTPVIVNWFSHDDGHYSVVTGVDKKRVMLLDPENGESRTFDHDKFMRVWFDFPSPYPRNRFQVRIRWMLPLQKR